MKKLSILLCLLLFGTALQADEGMWLVNLLEKNLTRQMKKDGLKMDPRLIYDEDQTTLSDAVVSMQFGCTGSMISSQGLLITNHHCAYSDIHAFSTPQVNYLEEGFWAANASEEKWVPGKSVLFLRKAYDVTDRVLALRDSLGSRRISAMLEKEYGEASGMTCMLNSMWKGSKYYLFCYQEYKDVRLVGAPPVSIAAFGGEADNWIWPQQKGDFALYRVYTAPDGSPAEYSPNNVPLVPKNTLTISTKGMKEGSYAMVMGYPYSTDRYGASYSLAQKQLTTYPIMVEAMQTRLGIMKKWMETDPDIRLQYADTYFSISNSAELHAGEVLSLTRHRVPEQQAAHEVALQQWVDTHPEQAGLWKTLLPDMKKAYEVSRPVEEARQWYRQTLISSTFLTMARRATNIRTLQRRQNVLTVDPKDSLFADYFERMERYYDSYNEDIEKEWFFAALRMYCEHVPRTYWGEYLQSVYDRHDGDAYALASFFWEHSAFSTRQHFRDFFQSPKPIDAVWEDPAYQLNESAPINTYAQKETALLEGLDKSSLDTQYTRALYTWRQALGVPQYPDANASMRLTFGTVGKLYPQDGVTFNWYSTTQGILDKWNPADYEFTVNPRMQQLLAAKDWGRWADKKDGTLHANFICDLDITGGNSGSPVMDAHGRLIGLAFDGNKESLGGDSFFHKDLNKCVCVDIRYVLWIIDKFAQSSYLLDEMHIE